MWQWASVAFTGGVKSLGEGGFGGGGGMVLTSSTDIWILRCWVGSGETTRRERGSVLARENGTVEELAGGADDAGTMDDGNGPRNVDIDRHVEGSGRVLDDDHTT